MDPQELKRIGKYEVLGSIGKGSMGVVYKAQDAEIHRIVAIKTLRTIMFAEAGVESEALKRFKQESRSAGKLQHPNIVTIYEAGRAENGYPYIVMEYIDGESLEGIITARAPLDPLEALHYGAQVASAIDYAHRQNVIHRDIKPSNVLIDQNFRPHLLDFGVAKLTDTSLTPAGTVVGTPSYMSPEQIRGEELDGGTDVFALAVMMFELLTGKRPFPGNDFTTVVSNIILQPPLTGAQVGVPFPAATDAVFNRALAKDRKERFLSGLDFIENLSRSFSTVVDGAGVLGGYRAGMTLAETQVKTSPSAPSGGSIDSSPATLLEGGTPAQGASFVRQSLFSRSPAERAARRRKARSRLWVRFLISGLRTGLMFFAVGLLVGGIALFFFPKAIEDFRALRSAGIHIERKEPSSDIELSESAPPPSSLPESLPLSQVQWTPEQISKLSDAELSSMLNVQTINDEVLRAAVREGAKRKSSEVLPGLVKIANRPSYLLRVELLKGFAAAADWKDPEITRVSIELLRDPEFLVRGYAAKVLTNIGGREALLALEEQEKVENNEVVLKIIKSGIAQIR